MDFRDSQVKRLKENPDLTIGDVTTLNITKMKGGVQNNVIPSEMTLGFDVRIAIDVDMDAFEKQV